MGITMLESTYTQYLNKINAEQFVIRTTFVLIGIFNFLGKLFSGKFLDQTKWAPVIFSLVGNVFMLLPYLSLGTLSYWSIPDVYQKWIVLATSPLLSCGFVFIFISTFSRMYHMKLLQTNAIDTSTLISGFSIYHRCKEYNIASWYLLQDCGHLLIIWECSWVHASEALW